MTEIRRTFGSPGNYDILICRRMECFFTPNPDGSPSVAGFVLFHTEWWQYSGDTLRGQILGPQIRHSIEHLMPGSYAGTSGVGMLQALKDMFVQVAQTYGDQSTEPPGDPEPGEPTGTPPQ